MAEIFPPLPNIFVKTLPPPLPSLSDIAINFSKKLVLPLEAPDALRLYAEGSVAGLATLCVATAAGATNAGVEPCGAAEGTFCCVATTGFFVLQAFLLLLFC